MKKLSFLTFLCVFAFAINTASAQCTIPMSTGEAGLDPVWQELPCPEEGVAYNSFINIENFATISGITVEYLIVDSITNVPDGLSYTVADSSGNDIFETGETGCISITGTPTAAGCNKLGIFVTVKVSLLPNPISGEAQEIIDQVAMGAANFDYFINVIAPGGTCDTLLCEGVSVRELTNVSGMNVFPNPVLSNATVTFTAKDYADYTMTVTDITGRTVRMESITATPGTNNVTFEKGNLNAGAYLVTISDGNNTATTRLMVR